MYKANGESVFVVDSHVHFWDASPENTLNVYGEGWINCFYDYHRNLSPPEWVWPLEKYRKYSEEDIMKDLFEEGYADVGIFLPTNLKDFFRDGFNTIEQDADRYGIKGVKVYTAEWKGDSRGWKLADAESRRYLDKCVELGVVNIHVHKGPTIWPLNKDSFRSEE